MSPDSVVPLPMNAPLAYQPEVVSKLAEGDPEVFAQLRAEQELHRPKYVAAVYQRMTGRLSSEEFQERAAGHTNALLRQFCAIVGQDRVVAVFGKHPE